MSAVPQPSQQPMTGAVPVADVLRAAQHHWSALPTWIRDAYAAGTVIFLAGAVQLTTPDGPVTAKQDDWFMVGSHGEPYLARPLHLARHLLIQHRPDDTSQ